ncbi:hypothetical protein [Haloechinothrix salitolerans]|uniref:Uncharacterized protein n=1 Tax=Haloechinothrix salitolerans TaxID=926830 RepID=A0ABW2BXB4_9PSEU
MARPSDFEHAEWPTNPLDAVRQAFAWLTAGDHPVAVDGRLFDHLPDRDIPVDELRDLLLCRSCPRRVWDQVWRHVITRVRAEGGTWTIVAVGLALPMLTPMATRLTSRYAADPADIHAEIVRGFLDALETTDLATGRIMIRLRWQAYRAGHRALMVALDGPTPKAPGFFSTAPKPSAGHPDLVLARAVRVGVLTPTEAGLIGATRLDGMELADWPHHPELTYEGLRSLRRRAEARLAAWLTEDDIGPQGSDPTGETASTRLSSGTCVTTPRPSRSVAERVVGAATDEPPNSGLQGRG